MKPTLNSDSEVLRCEPIVMDLAYLPPFDWESMLAFFRAHQVPDLETVDDEGYERIFSTKSGGLGLLRVTSNGRRNCSLRLVLTNTPKHAAPSIAKSVRRMFDLDADPKRIADGMNGDGYLGQLWSRYPGLRVARSWDRFETLVTTILGQVVAVSFGRTLTRELMQYGTSALHPATGKPIFLFPAPEVLASCDLKAVRTSEMRRTAIRAVCSLVASRRVPLDGSASTKELRRILLSTAGIGPWSAEYIAMRGFDDDDAFPATDYVLKQELKRHPEMNIHHVSPWRAYAAAVLSKSFAESKGVADESVL